MLKLIYTETGMHMELVATSLESTISQRALLAISLGYSLHIEAGQASFLLPADEPGLVELELAFCQERATQISLDLVDDGFIEVTMGGSWLSRGAEVHEGIFLTAMSETVEFWLYQLWKCSQARISSPV